MKQRQRKKPLAEINVVPYIDVMLVLLVIFMVTTPLLTQGVKVELPKAAAQAISAKDNLPIIVSVDRQGAYFLNISDKPQEPMSLPEIATRVSTELTIAKQQDKTRQVLVKGDQAVDYGKVVAAMVLLQQAGAASVGLMTQPDSAQG